MRSPLAVVTVRRPRSIAVTVVAEPQLDRLGAIEIGLAEQKAFPLHLAQQQALGQRRPLVGRMGLGPDQPDGAGMAAGAQGRRHLEAGLPGADDHDPASHRRDAFETMIEVTHGLALPGIACGEPSRSRGGGVTR